MLSLKNLECEKAITKRHSRTSGSADFQDNASAAPGEGYSNAYNLQSLPVNMIDSATFGTARWYTSAVPLQGINIDVRFLPFNRCGVTAIGLYDNCRSTAPDSVGSNGPHEEWTEGTSRGKQYLLNFLNNPASEGNYKN